MNPPALKSEFRHREQPGKWKYVLDADLVVWLGIPLKGCHIYVSAGRTIGRLDGSLLTLFPGYAIDGCSPAISVRGRRIGTPSPPSTLPAAFVHDFLYQFYHVECASWSHEEADTVFFHLLRQRRFPLCALYYGAVAVFGGLHRRITRKPADDCICLRHP